MNWANGKNGQVLIENGIILAYVTNINHYGDEMEEWKARVILEPNNFNPDTDLIAPPYERAAPINAKGRVQGLFLSETEAKDTVNHHLSLTIKDLLLLKKPNRRQ